VVSLKLHLYINSKAHKSSGSLVHSFNLVGLPIQYSTVEFRLAFCCKEQPKDAIAYITHRFTNIIVISKASSSKYVLNGNMLLYFLSFLIASMALMDFKNGTTVLELPNRVSSA
jgi:hypothetical protein